MYLAVGPLLPDGLGRGHPGNTATHDDKAHASHLPGYQLAILPCQHQLSIAPRAYHPVPRSLAFGTSNSRPHTGHITVVTGPHPPSATSAGILPGIVTLCKQETAAGNGRQEGELSPGAVLSGGYHAQQSRGKVRLWAPFPW